MCFVNIRFVCFHSGAAILRPIGEQYRVLCASVNSHIFFFFNQILYFDFSAYSAAAICVHCVNFCSMFYIHHLHIYNTAYIDYFLLRSLSRHVKTHAFFRHLHGLRTHHLRTSFSNATHVPRRLIFARFSIQGCILRPI